MMSTANSQLLSLAEVRYSLLLGGLTLVVWFALIFLDGPLRNDTAPLGMVSFELAGISGTAALDIIRSWSHQQQLCAAASLGLDYLFLVLYPIVLSNACQNLAPSTTDRTVGFRIARLLLLCCPLDALENACLLKMLLDEKNAAETSDLYAGLACGFAVPKFIILLIGIGYIFVGYSMQYCAPPLQGETTELHRD